MKEIDIEKLPKEQQEKVFDEVCPYCNNELKINYWDNDGGSFECRKCNIDFCIVY